MKISKKLSFLMFFCSLFFSCKEKNPIFGEKNHDHKTSECFVHEYDYIKLVDYNFKSEKLGNSYIYKYISGSDEFYSIGEINFKNVEDYLITFNAKLSKGEFGLDQNISGKFISRTGIRSEICGSKVCTKSLGQKSCWNPAEIIPNINLYRVGMDEPDTLLTLFMTYHGIGAPDINPRTEFWQVPYQFINDIACLSQNVNIGFGSDHDPLTVRYKIIGDKLVHEKDKVFMVVTPK